MIKVNGTLLSSLLDPYVEGTPSCPQGEIFEGGNEIAFEYAPIEFGSKGPNIGVKIDGVDISNYFAAAGTASYIETPWDGIIYVASVRDQVNPDGFAELFFRIKTDGTWEVYRDTSTAIGSVIASGAWLDSGDPSSYEVLASYTTNKTEGGGGGSDGVLSVSNDMSSYIAITATREIGAGLQRFDRGETIGNVYVTLNIRKIGSSTPDTSSLQLNLTVNTTA